MNIALKWKVAASPIEVLQMVRPMIYQRDGTAFLEALQDICKLERVSAFPNLERNTLCLGQIMV